MTNNFITLLAKLGIDTSNKADLEREIATFGKTLKGFEVKITGISPDAIKALEKMANFDFSKMAENAKNATAKVSQEAIKSAAEVQKAYKQAGDQIGNKDTFSLKHALTGVEDIKAALSKLHPTVKVDFDVTDGQKNLNKIKATFEKDGITTHLNFKQVEMGTKDGSTPVWMPVSGQDIDKKMTLAASATKEFDEKLNKLLHSGKITKEQFNELQATLKKTTDVTGFEKLNKSLDHMLIANKNATNALKDQQAEQKRIIENEQKRKELVNQVEAAIRSQKTMLNQDGATALLNNVKGLDIKSPDFSTAIKDQQILFNSLKLNAGITKEQEQTQKRMIENDTKRKNLVTDISSAMRNNKDTMNQEAAKGLLDTVKAMDVSSKDFGTTLGQHQSVYKLLKTNAEDLTRENKEQAKVVQKMITDQNTILINETKRAEMVNKIAAAMKAAPQTMDLNSAKGLLHSVENLDIASNKFNVGLKQSEVIFNQLKRNSDDLNKTLQTQESKQKTILENENKRKKLIDDINAAMKASANSMDQAAAKSLLTAVQNMNVASKDFGTTLGAHNVTFNALKLNSADVARTTKQQTDALKAQQDEQKRVIENDIKRQNLMIAIERSLLAQQRTIDRGAAESLKNIVKNMNPKDENFSTQLKENQKVLNQIKADATVASRANIGIIESFKIAMQKFPVWMAATTIFYSSIRTAREFMNIIIDIDTKMTSLAKVMSDDTDFEKIFDSATASAERFGQSISQVLDTYVEFARQGFKGDDLAVLSDAGLIAANVGEITAQKASEYMTAAIIQWKMEVEDGISIVDSWNNISNNFATTLDKLAQGHMRAGAAAKAMNLTFDQTNGIIGALTAATKQSGNEIGNFLKTALPRLVGRPGQKALATVGVDLTDDAGNIRDVIEVYTEVANKVKELSEVERIAVTEGLAGKYHITRMQILLDDLGSANSMYRQIYETSSDSVGSASRENEKYMESLQARINLARVEVEKLALAMGESFLTEGMIASLQGFSTVLGSITGLAGKIGALPIVLATVGVAVTLLSTKFKGLVGTMALTASASLINSTRFAFLSRTLTVVNAKVAGLNIAFKSLLAATGVGLALVAVGAGIEHVLRGMAKSREINEKIAQDNRELTNSYNTNKRSVNALVKQYIELEEAMKGTNPDLDTQKRYYDVQNELGSLMPSLIKYEDSYGNKILGSSSLIESKIKLLQSQIKAEETLAKIEKDKENVEKTEQSTDNVKDYKKLAKDTLWNFNAKTHRLNSNSPYHYKEEVKNIEEMATAVKWYEDKKIEYLEKGYEGMASVYGKTADDLRDRMADYEFYISNMDAANSFLAQESLNNAQKIISSNEEISDSTKELATNMLGDLTSAANDNNEIQLFANMFDNEELNDSLNEASRKIERFTKSTDTNFGKNKKVLEAYSKSFKTAILSGLKDSEGVSLAKDSKEYINAEKALDAYFNKLIISETAVREYAQAHKMSAEEARAHMAAHNEMGESLSAEMLEYIASLKELSSAVEQVAGVSEKFVSDSNDLIYTYENLSSMALYTAEQELELAKAKETLAALYPHLVHEGELRIENIKAEVEANRVLLEAVEASKEDLLTEEEKATANQLIETNARIRMINKNIEAIDSLIAAYAPMTNLAKMEYDLAVKSGNEQAIDDAAKALMRYSSTLESAKSAQAELATLEEARTGYVNTLSSALERIEEEQSKSNKTTKDSIYYTDKYKQSLEALNLEIEKQRSLRSNMLEYSQGYRDSLRAEIELEKQKEKLMRNQAASLEKQISSGKIIQTGSVSLSSSTGKLNGWSGSITSGFGPRNIKGASANHRGIDIDGNTGDRLDANVSGVVKHSGSATSQGYDKSYGNIVVIQDSNNVKHLYAHLEQVFAKVGDQIVAGTKIGTIGESGNAKGSHLHYEVNVNGKPVNPMDYITNAKNGISTIINSTGEAISNTQQSIDEAKSALNALQIELLGQQELLANLEGQLIRSYTVNFDRRREALDRESDYESEKIQTLDAGTEAYSKTINKQISILQRKKKVNEEDLAFTNDLIKNGGLNAVTLAEQKKRAQELTTANLGLTNSEKELIKTRIDGEQTGRQDRLDDIQEELDISQKLLETTEKFDPTNYDKQATILDSMVVNAAKYSDELNIQKQSLEDQLAALPEGSYEWKLINELVDQYNDNLHEANINVLTMAENLGNIKATNLVESAKKAIDFFNQGIEALGTIDTQFERNKAADYVDKIGDALEGQLSKITERMAEINIELSTTTAEEKIMTLRSELKSLTDARHTIRVEVVSNIEKLISQIQAFDIGKFDKVKDVLNDDWMNIRPTTLAGQQKYNDLLKERADAIKKANDAEKANQKLLEENQKKLEEYQATMEEARLSAMLEGAHDSLKQFSKYLDVIDHQLQMIEGGESTNVPKVDYNSVPRIKPLTPEQAAAQVKPPELEEPVEVEVEFVAPKTFVDITYEAFENELKSTWKTVDITKAKLKELGSVTPENKGQFLTYIQEMRKEVSDLENFAKSAKEALKRSFDLGEISKTEYEFRLEAIHNAELEIFAIPKLQIAEEAREQLILAGTEMANKSMNEMNERIKAQRLEIALLGDIDTSAEEAKVKNALQKVLDAYLEERERIIKRINEIKKALSAKITEDEKILLTAELEQLTVNLDSVAKGIDTVRKEFKGAPAAEVKVDANTALAKAAIEKLNGSRVTVQVDADVSAARSAISSLGSSTSIGSSGGSLLSSFKMPEIKIPEIKIDIPKFNFNFSSLSSYAKGTDGHSGGQAVVGERGKELVIEPDGTAYYTGSSPEIRDLPPGTQVFTAEETKKLLTNRKNKIPAYADGTNQFVISDATTAKINAILQKTLNQYLPTGLLNDISKITDKSVLLSFKGELHRGLSEGAKLLNAELLNAYNSLEKNYDGTFKNLEYAKSITDQMVNNVDIQEQAQLALKNITKELHTLAQIQRDRELEPILNEKTDLEHQLQLTETNTPEDVGKILSLNRQLLENTIKHNKKLKEQKLLIDSQMHGLAVGSDEWNILKEQSDAYADSIRDAEKETANLGRTIKETAQNAADEVIETIKRAFEKQRDIAIASIEKQLSKLDEEYRNLIDSIDDAESDRDYEKSLQKELDAQTELRKKISILSMDSSQEAKAKRIQLEKELADITENIEEMKHDRVIELKKKEIQEQYELNQKALEDEKEKTDLHYTELLDDERKFAQLREDIANGKLDEAAGTIQAFMAVFNQMNKEVANELGQSFNGILNIIDEMVKAFDTIGAVHGNAANAMNVVNSSKSILPSITNLIPSVASLIPSLLNNISAATSSFTNPIENNYNLTLNIASLNGTEADGENLAQTIMNTLKKMGK